MLLSLSANIVFNKSTWKEPILDVIYESMTIFHESLNNKEDLWTVVRTLARHVKNNWNKLDSGIWEFRTERKHFTFSKILCWVAWTEPHGLQNSLRKTMTQRTMLAGEN